MSSCSHSLFTLITSPSCTCMVTLTLHDSLCSTTKADPRSTKWWTKWMLAACTTLSMQVQADGACSHLYVELWPSNWAFRRHQQSFNSFKLMQYFLFRDLIIGRAHSLGRGSQKLCTLAIPQQIKLHLNGVWGCPLGLTWVEEYRGPSMQHMFQHTSLAWAPSISKENNDTFITIWKMLATVALLQYMHPDPVHKSWPQRLCIFHTVFLTMS